MLGISFRIPPWNLCGVVGATGCGKVDHSEADVPPVSPCGGDGAPQRRGSRDYTQHSFRSAVGVVPQDTVLFNDTIRYNLAYGRSMLRMILRLQRGWRRSETILRFPGGYDTVVGERAQALSGGRSRGFAIARTLQEPCCSDIRRGDLLPGHGNGETHLQTAIESVRSREP